MTHTRGAGGDRPGVSVQALTFGASIPVLYAIAAVAMFINTIDTKVKLRYVWPLPRRFGMKCTYMYLTIVKGMTYLHTLFAVWMFSYFRMHGQIVSAHSSAALACRCRGPAPRACVPVACLWCACVRRVYSRTCNDTCAPCAVCAWRLRRLLMSVMSWGVCCAT